jgi:hypothetical protein
VLVTDHEPHGLAVMLLRLKGPMNLVRNDPQRKGLTGLEFEQTASHLDLRIFNSTTIHTIRPISHSAIIPFPTFHPIFSG